MAYKKIMITTVIIKSSCTSYNIVNTYNLWEQKVYHSCYGQQNLKMDNLKSDIKNGNTLNNDHGKTKIMN